LTPPERAHGVSFARECACYIRARPLLPRRIGVAASPYR
jgi:hypothetical protein